ncbi:ABC transporter ATP-binding protein [Haloferula sp. A504]|uniref:ABC transporter ATP-binding protein n=1 Tax=Haloferula sp. A504 TaxID=3373601 RepID=UPI0031BE5B99|nr:ABC transporter ATP-binding protein/permease [Verrucomicrobiaceae bacterium E54]
MRKFWPYFALLRGARVKFAAAILAGVVYAVASGFGFPFMIKAVFPIIFNADQPVEEVQAAEEAPVEEIEKPSLVPSGLKAKFDWMNDPAAIRAFFVDRWGEEQGITILLAIACAIIPLVAGVRGIASFFNVYWMTGAGLHVLLQLQQSVFVKLQKLPLGFFSGRKTGDLISRVINDSIMLQTMVTTVANDLLKQPFTLIAALTYLTYDCLQNKELTFLIICLVSVPIVVLPIRMIGKRLMFRAAGMQHEGGDNSAILAETLGATREIRAFNLEDLMASRFLEGVKRWTKLNLKVIRYRFSTPPLIEFVAAAAVAAALGYGATQGLSLERFIAVVAALYMCYDPAKKLGEVHNRLKQGEASLDRLEAILHAEEGVTDPPNPVEVGKVAGDLRFENVEFSYADKPALRDVTVEIPAGQIVALVGPSGAGKTTFASLVPRFYDPTGGRVTLDGVDLREFRLKGLRDHITLVPQEAILLSGSIADNIGLGRLGASEEEIHRAAELANADAFIRDKKEGYDTPVGERGAELSGGQRQRISIARAFLKNAPVLILDEATASLDAESESQIQNELANLAKGRTTLIIAHRFSSIRIADRVLVFDEGRIVGDGSFDELAKSHKLFRKLLKSQLH